PSLPYSVTALPDSAVPVKVGVVLLVMLSVFEEPVSLAAARSGAVGAVGAAVSMVTERPPEAALVLPAASVALAVIVWLPEPSAELGRAPRTPVAVPLGGTVVPSRAYSVPGLPDPAAPGQVGGGLLVSVALGGE